MGRPKQKTLLASFDPLVIEHILRLRNEGRKVGPKSIYSDLQQTKQLDSLELPKPSTIAVSPLIQGRSDPINEVLVLSSSM